MNTVPRCERDAKQVKEEVIGFYWYEKEMHVSRLGYLPVYAICRQLLHAQAKCRAVMKL